MHLLRKISFLIIIIMIFGISCKSEGPLTPEQAFEELRNSYHKKNASAVINVLSNESIEKITIFPGILVQNKVRLCADSSIEVTEPINNCN